MGINFPDAPSINDVYGPYIWDGEKWDYAGGSGIPLPANITVSDDPPPSPIPGDLWYESNTGFVFVRVDDGTSAQWAVINPTKPIAGPQGLKGDQGIQGEKGDQGIQGIQGIPGDMQEADADLKYVDVAGDVMTGNLSINKNDAALILNQTGASNNTNYSRIDFNMGGSKRWEMSGAWGIEAAGNVGSDWSIERYDNAGVVIDSVITVKRSDGKVTIPNAVAIGKALSVNGGLHGWPITIRTGANANLGMFDGGAGIANFGCINDVGDQWMTLNLISKTTVANTFTPVSNGGANLGTAALRFATVYTQDLSLSNGIGDWTIVEGEDDLFLYNNLRGKVYKFWLVEVPPEDAPAKAE